MREPDIVTTAIEYLQHFRRFEVPDFPCNLSRDSPESHSPGDFRPQDTDFSSPLEAYVSNVSPLHVVVQNLAGETVAKVDNSTFDFHNGTIFSLKQILHNLNGINPDEQNLVHGHEVLEDSCRIVDLFTHGLEREVVLCLVREESSYVVTGGVDKTLSLWDLKRRFPRMVLTGHTDHVICCATHRPSQRALSSSRDGAFRLWDLRLGSCIHVVAVVADYITSLAVDWDRNLALTGNCGGSVQLWDLHCAVLLKTLSDASNCNTVPSVDVDWTSMLAVSAHADSKVRLWDAERGVCLQSQNCSGSVSALTVDWRARSVLCGGGDGSLRLLHLDAAAARIMKGHIGRIVCVQADWELQRASSASWDGTIRLWDLNSLTCLRTLRDSKRQCGHKHVVSCISTNWISMRVVSGHRNGKLRLWSFEDEELIDEWDAHQAPILCIASA